MSSTAIADTFIVSANDQARMLSEADDWIDEMPDGLQDKLSDAVAHSLRGFYSELNYFRNQSLQDTTPYSNVKTTQLNIKDANIKVRLYCQKGKENDNSKPLLIYFHGGGWTMGSMNASDKFCRAIVATGIVDIASVDYPLAPETYYADIINKSSQAVRFLNFYFKNKRKIEIGGDGAGGNLAISVFYNLQKHAPSIKINSLILYYPLLSVNQDRNVDSWRKYSRGYGLDGRVMESYSVAYGAQPDSSDYITSISQLTDTNIKKLPPILIIMSGRDIIIDEEKSFIKRLNKNGVKVQSVEFNGAIHGFITDNNQPTAFKKAVELTKLFLKDK